MKSILDPSFKYTSSANTDIAKTFARIRREQRRVAEAPAPPPGNVAPLVARRALTPRAA
jgi:hypothetical protein